MKALIYCQEDQAQALLRYLPESHGYLVPFLNKPLLSHWLESLYLLGVSEVRIVARRSWMLQQALGDGQALGLKLSFQSGQEQDELQTVLQKNQGFAAQEPVLCVQGYGLLLPPEAPVCLNLPADTALMLHPPGAAVELYWLPARGQVTGVLPALPAQQQVHSQALPDLQSYYLAQLGLLASDDPLLNLPAYGELQGAQVGAGLQRHPSARIAGRSLLGHRCQLAAHTQLTQSVLGDDVVVASGTTLRQCLVLPGSWIGPHLHLQHKLIKGKNLIDPFSGEVLSFEGADFFSEGYPFRAGPPLWQRLLALLLCFSAVFSGRRHLLLDVIRGHKPLIDLATPDVADSAADLISYADALGHCEPVQRQFDNICYQQQRSLKMDLLICWLWLKKKYLNRAAKCPDLSVLSPTAAPERDYPETQFGSAPVPETKLLSSGAR